MGGSSKILLFFRWGGFIFKWGVPHGGALVLMGKGVFEKNCWTRGGVPSPPHTPPLWKTLGGGGYMLKKNRIGREVGFFNFFFHFFVIVFFLLFTKSI